MQNILLALFIIISFFGIKICKTKDFNENSFDIDNCNAIKAICTIVVVFCHLSDYINDSLLFKLFGGLGTFAVSVFFLFSGSGVMKSYIKSGECSLRLLLKRIKRIIKPYIIIFILYVIVYFIFGYSINKLIDIEKNAIYTGDTIILNSWFIFIIIALYVLFFISTKLLKKKEYIVCLITIIDIINIVIMKRMLFSVCWYITTPCFIYGLIYALHENNYNQILKKNYLLFFIINLCLLILCFYLNHEVFIDNSNVIFDIIKYIVFDNMLIVLTMKISLGNKILSFLHNISLQVYLSHGLILYLLSMLINNDFILSMLVLAISIVISTFIKKIS